MDLFTVHLIDDNEPDHLVTTELTTDAHRLQLVHQLRDALRRPVDVHDPESLRNFWLLVFSGDLKGREDRRFETLDAQQIRQVYDYVHRVLSIRLPPFGYEYPDSNRHLWRFFCAHRSDVYRISQDPALQHELDEQWREFDTAIAALRESSCSRSMVEDQYFVRGLWVAQNELESLERAHAAKYKFYDPVRGIARFNKLFGYHGKRDDLVDVYSQWKQILFDYGPAWMSQNLRRNNEKAKGYVKDYAGIFGLWRTLATKYGTHVEKQIAAHQERFRRALERI